MWGWLRNRRFSAYKFRRQHPQEPYTFDFYCHQARLAIELDGSQHGSPEKQKSDAARDAYAAALGIKTLRFWNSRLRKEKEAIRNTIWAALQERAPQIAPWYTRTKLPPESSAQNSSDSSPEKCGNRKARSPSP